MTNETYLQVQILVAGGCDKWCEILNIPDEQPLASAEIFDLQTLKWKKAADMPTPLSSAKLEYLGGVPTTIGGYDGFGKTNKMYQYDVTADKWTINEKLRLKIPRNKPAVFQVPRTYFRNC